MVNKVNTHNRNIFSLMVLLTFLFLATFVNADSKSMPSKTEIILTGAYQDPTMHNTGAVSAQDNRFLRIELRLLNPDTGATGYMEYYVDGVPRQSKNYCESTQCSTTSAMLGTPGSMRAMARLLPGHNLRISKIILKAIYGNTLREYACPAESPESCDVDIINPSLAYYLPDAILSYVVEAQTEPLTSIPPPSQTYSVTFTVLTASNNLPLYGTTVVLDGVSRTTDINGVTTFRDVTSGNHTYEVNANTYNINRGTVAVSSDVSQTVLLSPIPPPPVQTYSVTFTVLNANNNLPIQGATVILDGIGRTTDANGNALFIGAAVGGHNYEVSVNNYNTNTGRVVVSSDVSQTVFLNAIVPQWSIQFTPITNSQLNYSFTPVSVLTNIASECRWDYRDVSFENMANNFSTTDNLTHSATISGFTLGSNTFYFACKNAECTGLGSIVYSVMNILDGSTLVGNNSINNSVITNSTITNSTISNSTVTNSILTNIRLTNARVSNNVISAGQITINGVTYDASNGTLNLSAFVNVAPIANFIQSATSINPQTIVVFTSTSTDANIPGPLNDVLQFVWDFGDGTNATGSSVSKTYNSVGSFTVKLIVTDKFGLSSNKTSTVTVNALPVTYATHSSSSSRSRSRYTPIEVIRVPVEQESVVQKTVVKTNAVSNERKQSDVTIKTVVPNVGLENKNIKTQGIIQDDTINTKDIIIVESLLFFSIIGTGLMGFWIYRLLVSQYL